VGSLTNPMRRLSLLTAAVVVLAAVPAASGKTLFVITGRGWGHGVGMSQYGAYGMATQGKTYRQILGHYYRGTTVGTHSGRTIRVLLASGRTSLTIGSAGAFTVGTRTHSAGQALVTKTATGRIRVQGFKRTFAGPVRFAPTGQVLRLGTARYRGTIVVSVSGGRLRAVNSVGLEHYVRGVVANESPSWWPAHSLRAQAVAARSYALATGGHCGGGLFCPDTSDQVYRGVESETRSTNDAVEATTRQVVRYQGSVAQTFFSSSNGGRTASSADTWGGSLPYLRSVPDAADLNAANPNRFWRELRTARQIRSALGLSRTPLDGKAERNASDRVRGLRFTAPGWEMLVVGSDSFRGYLGLKSNRFWLGVLGLRPQADRVVYGNRVRLDVLVRRLSNGALERRAQGTSAWRRVAPVAGAESILPRPLRTVTYRLRGGGVAISELVRVAPRITARSQGPRRLSGSIRPLSLAGETIVVERRLANGGWRRAAVATVAANGTWRVTVGAGRYRAVITPPGGSGLVRGFSPVRAVDG
jgi:stage II sporulation protein D